MDHKFARKLFRTPDEFDLYREQRASFRRKFGREMAPEDPFFFDPEAEAPQFRRPDDASQAIDQIALLMQQAGVDPATVYAFRKTRGLFPTPERPLSPEQMSEWTRAISEYHRNASATRKS